MVSTYENIFREAEDILKHKIARVRLRGYIYKLTAAVLCVSFTAWILFSVIFELEIVDGDSMSPSLRDGDMALAYRLEEDFTYGDVVLLSGLSKDDYIKRIIGLPGDIIDIDGETGKVLRNGIILAEPYVAGPTLPREEGVDYPLQLADGEYFLLGDNRTVSCDGRVWGATPKKNIKAKVIWPFYR